MSRPIFRTFACLCVLGASVSMFAQTSRFLGRVTDPQGASIANAAVVAVNQESFNKASTKTGPQGDYVLPYLPAGVYTIEVRASGFSAAGSGPLDLAVGQAYTYNVQLTVGEAQSTVNVNAVNELTQINTQNAEISGTITGKEVTALQLNGRNFTQLIALAPGVSNQTQQDEARVGAIGSVAYSVNGGRTEYNSFQVDGAETLNTGINRDHSTLIVYPSVDAIQEIKVLTSNYGAQYPSSGNGTTLVTTRSGTDLYHGVVYEFLRNESLNARGYFDVTVGAPLYRRNDFGGTIGGPLRIPHLYDGKGRTHFFFSEEARTEKDPYPYRVPVPSLRERGGDFSDVCLPAGAPPSTGNSGNAYPDCPTTNHNGANPLGVPVSTVATAILDAGVIPLPNSHYGCNSPIGSCYLAEVSLPTYYREELFRIDQNLGQRTVLSFRYIHDEWDTTQPTPYYAYVQNTFPSIQNRFYGPGLSLVAQLATTLSARWLNAFTFSYIDSHIKLADTPAAAVSLARPAKTLDAPVCARNSSDSSPGYQSNIGCGLGNIFNNGFGGKLPGIVIAGNNAAYGGTGFATDPGYAPWEHKNPVYAVHDNVSWTLGRHGLEFGAEWLINQRNQTNGPIGAATGDIQGLLTFSNERSINSSGNAFADFLGMNAIASFQQDSAQRKYYQRYQIVEPFVQDNWKVSTRLTLNAGIRLSLFGTYHEKNKNAYNWVPSAYSQAVAETVQVDGSSGQLLSNLDGSAIPVYGKDGNPDPRLTNGIVRCGLNGVPGGCMKNHLWNWAPRVGFAWDPLGNGKSVVRAGYGIFFEHGTGDEANTGSLEGSSPLVLNSTQLNPDSLNCIGNLAANCSAFGPGAFPLNVTSIPTRARWSNVQQWSLSGERQFTHNALATLAYVGSKGTHLTAEREINQLLPVPDAVNPFGKHEPLLTETCSSALTGKGGNNGSSYTLPSGATVSITDPAFVNLQVACYGDGANVEPNSYRKFAPGLGEIYSLENVANSAYNAFQGTLRVIDGPLTLGVAYTYSHSIDDASDRSDSTFVNSFNLKQSRSSSNFDQRHLLHVSYIYDLPLRHGLRNFLSLINRDPDPEKEAVNRPPSSFLESRFSHLLFDNWQWSGITLLETGIPFTVVNGGSSNGNTIVNGSRLLQGVSVLDNAGVANGVGSGSYPDLAGAARTPKPRVSPQSGQGPLLLNPGNFVAPRALTFGNSGRNVLNNPRRTNFDMTLQKNFALRREGMSLQFRGEAFNVFNHTQFRIYNPLFGNQANNTVSCYAAGGGFSAAGDANTDCLANNVFLHPYDAHRPRTLQFGLKLAF